MKDNFTKYVVLTVQFYLMGFILLYLGFLIFGYNDIFLMISLAVMAVFFYLPFVGLYEEYNKKWHLTEKQKKVIFYLQISTLFLMVIIFRTFVLKVLMVYLYLILIFISAIFGMDFNPYIE